MFSPVGVANTGYPTLAASTPPAYGPLNPRPAASVFQSPTSGPLFGEQVTAPADASLFNVNVSPDVATVCATLDAGYFPTGVKKLHAPQGTIVYLKKAEFSRRRQSDKRSHTAGPVHTAFISDIPHMQKFRPAKSSLEYCTFATVCVGPVEFVKGMPVCIAVAVQNCCHITHNHRVAQNVKPGDVLRFDYDQPHGIHVVPAANAPALTPNRSIRIITPIENGRMCIWGDLGAHIP